MSDKKLNSIQAAEYLGYHPTTMRISRSTGKLRGRKAPKYYKDDYKIYYLASDLDAWKEKSVIREFD